MHLSHDAELISQMVALLLKHGADPTLRDAASQLAFHKACAIGNVHAIEAMLGAAATRATVLTLDSDGLPPPFHALEVGQVEAFRLLQARCPELDAAIRRNKSSLNGAHGPNGLTLCQHIVFVGADPKMMRLLLEEAGCSPDHECPVKTCGTRAGILAGRGLSALCSAAGIAHDLVRVSDVVHATCLHMAASRGQLSSVRLLLAKGVDINSPKHNRGLTPLHVAARFGHAEIARALVDAGASLNARDSKGRTPAHLAARRGHAELARELEPPSATNIEAPQQVSLTTALSVRVTV